jgi:hemolysin activation/secretion protein
MPWLGRPLSRKLIAEIEASIARYYRQRGFPFVSLSTPPQNIGNGVLQIRVLEFMDGKVSVQGAADASTAHLRSLIRQQPGAPIDTYQLTADLDWLNRYPFRQAQAVFTPAASFGRSDLDIQITETKPWRAFLGYANSGTETTGMDRYFAGAMVGGLLTPDSVLSYQYTTSHDGVDVDGHFGGEYAHSRYLSHGLHLDLPFAPRQKIELTFNHVETNTDSESFLVRNLTDELSVGHRFSLSNISRLPGDLAYGVEVKRESQKVYFGYTDVLDSKVETNQIYLNWNALWQGADSKTGVDATLHISPGGLNANNTDQAMSTFTRGRVSNSDYQYLNVHLTQLSRLPKSWSVRNELIMQLSSNALPNTEQAGIGGEGLVRGYLLDDGAYDSIFVSRNELHLPTFNMFGDNSLLMPYLFVDGGYGRNHHNAGSQHALSAGIGMDYQLGSTLSASASVAHNFGRPARRTVGITQWKSG